MSSGAASPVDTIVVLASARRLYRQCRNAGGEYLEISREVRGLHTVLKHLKYEVQAPESILNRDLAFYDKELVPRITDCELTFRQLDGLLLKYDRLGNDDVSGKGLGKARFGNAEMDQLGEIRLKLINHKSSITVFLDAIQLGEPRRISASLETNSEQLDLILDKVDKIAARMSHQAGPGTMAHGDDDNEMWKQFRRELIQEGFSGEILRQNRDVLRAYIREIDQNGLLEDVPSDSKTAGLPDGSSERWLDKAVPHTQSPQPEQSPPSFDSINAHVEDPRTKELVVSEENIKFLPSVKTQRPKPESKHQDNGAEYKALPFIDTTVSRYEPEKTLSALITTTELVASENYSLGPSPSSSPVDSRSSAAFVDDYVPRSMARRPRTTLAPESASYQLPSPSQYGTSPQSARARTARLAPDSQGNEIPLEATWTRIRRSLVSCELLERDRMRYEARPDFVAILGVLSRDEIEDLAARSQNLREYRREKALRSSQPPPKPPRPEEERRRRVSFEDRDREYSSDEMGQGSQRVPIRERQSYPSVNPPYHPNRVYGTSPSRVQTAPQQWTVPQYSPVPTWSSPPSSPQPSYYLSHGEARRPSRPPSEKSEKSEKSKIKEKERERKSRWGQNLTAAGIGGAAVGLLNVLAEAAEAM